MKQFNKIDINTFSSKLACSILASLTIMFIWLTLKTGVFFLFFLIPWLIFLSIIIIYILNSKVLITAEEVIIKSPFSSKRLKFDEIKTIGVYVRDKYSSYILKPENYNDDYAMAKFIYLSAKEHFNPFVLFRPNDLLEFHYNSEAYSLIISKVKANV